MAAAVFAASLATSVVLAAPNAAAAPADDNSYQPAVPGPVKTGYSSVADHGKLAGGLEKQKSGTYRVFVQIAGTGAVETAKATKGQGTGRSKAAVQAKKASIAASAAAVTGTAKSKDRKAVPLFTTVNSVPGIAISADTAALQAVAARTDVVKITPLVPKKLNNAGAAQFTKVLNTWQDTGLLGTGVKVGIIDTGIDYTHADFGGPGTVAAYDAAHAAAAGSWTPSIKVAGGYDFAGDDYDADPDSDNYQPVPHPDPNPLDCNGHGTHVAGTVAGYGENADGTTFRGDYRSLTGQKLFDMKIGPGMAPAATLYALKVFGCEGSTDVTAQALDWALDPNGDGDFSDHLDIVNLSLGSDFGTEDDPENAIVDVLAVNGVLPVIAMGNAGDVTDAGGTPGNAVRSLAVASVVDPYQLRDGLRVDAPADLAGVYAGQNSVAYDWSKPPVTGDVVAIPGNNADGCAPLSAAEAAAVKGKVAWLEWDDNDATRRCGSAGRSSNVQKAGAIGALFTSQLDAFPAGITGSALIPVFQLGGKETVKLRPAVTAGTLRVTFDGTLAASIKDVSPAIGDTISDFSSRGTHSAMNPVKPDVAAPGSTITSAGFGTGDKVLTISGTSMATPHVAGISALLKQAHPTWTPEQLKADIMNTAGHDVYTKTNQSGDIYGPARVGAGRVDALAATTNTVLAYNTNRPGGVSASFGVVWAPADQKTVTRTQQIAVQNTAQAATKLAVSYQPVVNTPGVSYSVSPSTLTLTPGGTSTVTVTMTVTTAALDHTIDPTMSPTDVNILTGLDELRQYETDASGRVLLTPTGKPSLRVPVYGVAKPYSTTTAHKGSVKRQPSILLDGAGVSGGITSLVSVLQLGGTSGRLPACSSTVTTGCVSTASERAGDIQYVGAGSAKGASGYQDGYLWFGISTYADWATIGHSMLPWVDFDTTGDGKPDYEVYARALPNPQNDDTDLIDVLLVDLNADELISIAPLNYASADVDTNVFDGNVVLLPVDPAAIGITATTTSFPISYVAGTVGYNGTIDAVDGGTFDVVKPALAVDSPLYVDANRTAIPYTKSGKGKVSAMVVHLNGRPGNRTDIVKL